jgi:hypothetical protein
MPSVDAEDVAMFVHTTMYSKIEKKMSKFSIGFMPTDWQAPYDGNGNGAFSWHDNNMKVTYVVVTKDVENVLEALPELVHVENRMTLFVIPNYAPPKYELQTRPDLDVVADGTRIFFYVLIGMMIFSWLYANLVYKKMHLA